MVEDAADLLGVVGALHEGVVDPHAWDAGLGQLSDLIGAAGLLIGGADPDIRHISLSGHRIAQKTTADLAGPLGNTASNPYLAALRKLPLRRVVGHEDVGGQVAVEASVVWRKVMDPSNLVFTRAAILERQVEWSDFVVTARGRLQGDFTSSSLKILAAIVPHLGRALRAKRELDRYRQLASDAMAALNALPRGVLLVDAKGHVQFANRVAEEIMHDDDGLSIRKSSLVADHHLVDRELKRLLHRAAETARGRASAAADAMPLARPSGRPSLTLIAEPLSPPHGEELGAPTGSDAIVFLSDPTKTGKITPDRVAAVYALTASETRVTMLALRGGSLKSLANSLGLSENTIKTHLRSIYAKVGATNHTQLCVRVTADLGL